MRRHIFNNKATLSQNNFITEEHIKTLKLTQLLRTIEKNPPQ